MKHRITAWSYSRADVYKQCPRRAYYLIAGPPAERPVVQEERSPALERGTRLHEEAEKHLSIGAPLSDPVWFGWKKEFERLREYSYAAERKFVFDPKWRTLDDWFHKRTWLRASLDASVEYDDVMNVVDYKTGREYATHVEQAELYALAALRATRVSGVNVEFWYLDSCDIAEYQFTRDADFDRLDEKWTGIGRQITGDRRFDPTPGRACTAYGRPCPFGPDGLKLCPGTSQ